MSVIRTYPIQDDLKLQEGSFIGLISPPTFVDQAGFELRKNQIAVRDCLVAFLDAETRFCLIGMKVSSSTFHELVVKGKSSLLDIDSCRIPTNDSLDGGITSTGKWTVDNQGSSMGYDRPWMHDEEKQKQVKKEAKKRFAKAEELGRYPPNLMLSDIQAKYLDEQSFDMGIHGAGGSRSGSDQSQTTEANMFGVEHDTSDMHRFGDEGGASRFFHEINTESELVEHLETLLGVEDGYSSSSSKK